MPTSYPKSTPTEMLGLLILLNSHKGSEDVALLADDLDLEIDEILPSLDAAQMLGFVKVADGRATFTDLGRQFVGARIRERKEILRDQLKRTTLFKTLLRALENAPEKELSEEQLYALVAFVPGPVEEAAQNIINWGRYAELVRYDSENRRLAMVRHAPPAKAPSGARPPPPPAGARPPPKPAPAKAPPTAPEPPGATAVA